MRRNFGTCFGVFLSAPLVLAVSDAHAHQHDLTGPSGSIAVAQMTMDPAGEMSMDSPKAMAGMMRPDMAPPVGVMGGMSPKKGTIMVSVSYMRMRMDGNRDGDDHVKRSKVLSDFMVAPLNMDENMLMGTAMYAITDDISVMGMVPYVWKEMDHVTRMGDRFTTRSDGIGDVRLVGGYDVYKSGGHTVKLSAGLSFPTGDISEKDDTPSGPNQVLPYPMQNGSGSYDLLAGVSYTGRSSNWSWGSDLSAVIPTGENSHNYTVGRKYLGSAWGARKWTDWFSSSLRISADIRENYSGADNRLNRAQAPTADPGRRAGRFISTGLGLNFLVPSGALQGMAFSVEGIVPVYQNLDGPQLEREYTIVSGIRMAF